jgi:hypothetical protein
VKGTALVFKPGVVAPEVTELDKQPTLEWLQSQVGGYIELVPGFDRVAYRGEWLPCRVLCNEHGKISDPPLPLNYVATVRWNDALRGALIEDGKAKDVLVGPILVLIGDEEFMREL